MPPVLTLREVEHALDKLGFSAVRQKGSHRQYRHPDGRATTVPVHAGRDIGVKLLRLIARDIGMTLDDFVLHRK